MKILIFLAALMFVTPAFAGSNIKQKDTGATVWENQDGVEYPVGGSSLTISISDITAGVTWYAVTHRPGVISKVYAVVNGADSLFTTAGARFQIFFGSAFAGGVSNNFTNISVAAAADRLELTSNTSGDTAIPINGVFTPSNTETLRTVGQGQIIGILSDGNATEAVGATITIVIE